MKRLLLVSFVLASVVLLIAACAVSTPGGKYTVSGTVYANSIYIADPASVTVSQGGNSYTVSVTISLPDEGGNQAGTYSISDVPPGNYKIEAIVTNPDLYYIQGYYAVDGGEYTQVSLSSSGPAANEWTVTIDSLSIEANHTIDVDLSQQPSLAF